MEILHKIDAFLFELFPRAKQAGNNLNVLVEEVIAYYTYEAYKPKVEVNEGWIKVRIDIPAIISQAKKYLEQALSLDPDYPNTHFGLSMIAESEGDLQSAFYSAIQAIKKSKKKDVLYENSLQQAFSVAKQVMNTGIGANIVKNY